MPQPDPVSRFHAALAGAGVAPGLLALPEAEGDRRFAVYRNNVAHSLGQALARRYPVICRLVGAEFFAAMAPLFIAAHPPATPVLQEWGAAFPAWLARFPPVAALRYLADVARIEWLRGEAYHAADAAPLAPGDLSADRPLCLHPSLRLVRSDWPAVSIWQANQPSGDGTCSVAGPEIGLIWRRADFEVPVLRLGAEDARLFAALHRGLPLAQAAQGHDPVPLLTRLLADGLVCEG